jgi:hypothetical protein
MSRLEWIVVVIGVVCVVIASVLIVISTQLEAIWKGIWVLIEAKKKND